MWSLLGMWKLLSVLHGRYLPGQPTARLPHRELSEALAGVEEATCTAQGPGQVGQAHGSPHAILHLSSGGEVHVPTCLGR